MKAGFARRDITPRVGVELCGFGPFLNRHSVGVRDRLWARAMALQDGEARAVVVSCDLVGVSREITAEVRNLVHEATGVPREALMVSCTHTHSGPNTTQRLIGWGTCDPPYVELLPGRITGACIEALERLQEVRFSYAETPCEGIGLNREYDRDAPPLEEVLREEWRPARPELTDTTCHVLKAEADGRIVGFVSYFGCHPVVCCAQNRHIHGDFCGVATGMLEREHPGSVGLFLQGANGDVNSCVVHKEEQESLLALDLIASRYANAVRAGLQKAEPIEPTPLRWALREVTFTRKQPDEAELRRQLEEQESILHAAGASDAEREVRMAAVRAIALRRLIRTIEQEGELAPPHEVHALRLGPITLLGSPFETFQAIKNEVRDRSASPVTLVLSLVNDSAGYAPDRVAAERGGYAQDVVPLLYGSLPYGSAHDELAGALLELEQDVL